MESPRDRSFSHPAPADPKVLVPRPSTVLIVEDDDATACSLSVVLGNAGYRTVVCQNGTAALRSAEQVRPSAAMIDIHLPDLNGLILTSKLRQQLGPDVPIIVVSGDTSMEMLNSLAHVGATYFLSKPMSPSIVLERLGECIRDSARKAC